MVLIMMGWAAYFILFFPKFQVARIEISGNDKIQTKEIENIAWQLANQKILDNFVLHLWSKSIFLVDNEKLAKDINGKYPSIENIIVKRKLPNTIKITVLERRPFAAFCQNNDFTACFVIDRNGVIFEELKNREGSFILRQETGKNLLLGENAVSKDIMDIIDKIARTLKNNFQIDIREIFVSDPLVLKTSEGWKVYFDLASDIDFQISKMDILLKNEISLEERKNLQYIYLQYKDRAYYK